TSRIRRPRRARRRADAPGRGGEPTLLLPALEIPQDRARGLPLEQCPDALATGSTSRSPTKQGRREAGRSYPCPGIALESIYVRHPVDLVREGERARLDAAHARRAHDVALSAVAALQRDEFMAVRGVCEHRAGAAIHPGRRPSTCSSLLSKARTSASTSA